MKQGLNRNLGKKEGKKRYNTFQGSAIKIERAKGSCLFPAFMVLLVLCDSVIGTVGANLFFWLDFLLALDSWATRDVMWTGISFGRGEEG